MLLLTAQRSDGTVDLMIVLEDDNVARIKEYDPAEITWSQLPWRYSSRMPHAIGVAYATAEEVKKIQEMVQKGESHEAMEFVSRGFRYRPENGDHDFGPVLLPKTFKTD